MPIPRKAAEQHTPLHGRTLLQRLPYRPPRMPLPWSARVPHISPLLPLGLAAFRVLLVRILLVSRHLRGSSHPLGLHHDCSRHVSIEPRLLRVVDELCCEAGRIPAGQRQTPSSTFV